MELHDAADELYTVGPEEFVAARTELADRARDGGDRRLAKEIAGLSKPTSAAWVCNVLVRHHREEIEGLIELGGLLREAQSSLAGDQLRALNSQRGQLLSALTRHASALARELGHPVSSAVATQVEQTLRAALADPAAGEAVLSGRLTSALSYSGGPDAGAAVARPDLRLVRPKPAPARTRPKASPKDDPRPRTRDRAAAEQLAVAERRAKEERRRSSPRPAPPPRRPERPPARRPTRPGRSASVPTNSPPAETSSRAASTSSPRSCPGCARS